MKVFEIALPGNPGILIVAENKMKSFERRGELDPSFEFLPVEAKELEVDGFNIYAEPKEKKVKEPELPPEDPKAPLEKPSKQQKANKQKSKE